MVRRLAVVMLAMVAMSGRGEQAIATRPAFQAFDAATVKPVDPDHAEAGRYYRIEGVNRFVVVNYTLKLLIAAAYDLNPRTISGGPGWVDSAKFNIVARAPGDLRPERSEQMRMLRALLLERFGLQFHREQKTFSLYELQVAKDGPKLKASTAAPDEPPQVISTVYPDRITLPARNVTMGDFVAMMQRALLDRPVVDKTGLTGRYDFDLTWAPDETQFQGEAPKVAQDVASPPLFTALPQQLGLRLEATRGPVSALVIDKAQPPTSD
jgi:uncharacterized protein (TIGR03435 family)